MKIKVSVYNYLFDCYETIGYFVGFEKDPVSGQLSLVIGDLEHAKNFKLLTQARKTMRRIELMFPNHGYSLRVVDSSI